MNYSINGNSVSIEHGTVNINGTPLQLDQFYFISRISHGDNGVVLKAQELVSERLVAVKIWLPNHTHGKRKSNETRSVKEIQKLVKFDSRYIVKYYTGGIVSGYTYCAMEYIDGKTLEMKLLDDAMNLSDRYFILMNVLSGLKEIHEKGVFHGDLHTKNVMITEFTNVKILDLGTSYFSGNQLSLQRDSRYMFETGLKILGSDKASSLVIMTQKEIEQTHPYRVRVILKCLAKIYTLLEFVPEGLTDAIVEDIAVLLVLVPVFDLRLVFNTLFADDLDVKLIARFKSKLAQHILLRYQMLEPLEFDNDTDLDKKLVDMYQYIYADFLNHNLDTLVENMIFQTGEERIIFNHPLFHLDDINEIS